MLFVRMLIIILQRIQRSIQTKEACLPVITAASPITSDPNAHSSRSLRFRGSCQLELHQALYLLWRFRLQGISSSLFLPIRVANQRRTNQGATRESRRSPLATMTMKGFEPDARYAKENGQHGQDLQATATSQAGMGKKG
jgi:hypothetical protein